jgi:23S rRNA (cytidine1920-2'-O)/16S rRNA (cytidine1409-2'-O)-methyltransferase
MSETLPPSQDSSSQDSSSQDSSSQNASLRLDQALVARGLFETRARAQAAIAARLVRVDGVAARKASQIVLPNAVLAAESPYPYVSRGGVKLAAALDHFGIDPAGSACLDIGASTGGFTDCLLQRGASHVLAVDVGTDQLHAALRKDPRVTSLEQTDIRALKAERPVDIVVIDVSFISLADVLPEAGRFAKPDAKLVALIKPQFEAGRKALKKGVVRDAAVHAAVVVKAREAAEACGWHVLGVMPSPIEGGDGNREFLLAAQRK